MDRQTLAAIKRLLLARDLDAIVQGVELAVSLGDGELVDALLSDVHYDDVSEVHHQAYPGERGAPTGTGRLLSRATFAGNGKEQPYFDQALVGLVARGPGARATALRAEVRRLTLGSAGDGDPPFDLALLVGLDALEELAVHANAGVRNIGRIAALPRLAHARIDARWRGALSGLEGIADAPALETLSLQGRVSGLSALAGSRVRDLTLIDRDCDDLDGLARMPRLVTLHLEVAGPFGGLSGAAVERLRVKNGRNDALPKLGALPRLRWLTCQGGVRGLTSAPELEELSCADAGHAPPFPKLVRAKVGSLQSVVASAPAFPALEEVTCGGMDVEHWGQLRALPRLRRIAFEDTYVYGRLGVAVIDCQAATTDDAPDVDLRSAKTGEPITRLRFLTKVTSLRGLGRFPQIEELTFDRCAALTTLDGLEGLRALRALDLRGCTALRDAGALAGLDLRVIAAFGCPLAAEGGIPDDQAWAVTRAQDADLPRLARRSRPARAATAKKPKAPPPVVDEALWSEIAAAIQLKTHAGVDRAADLAARAGLPAYDRLLRGASYVDGELRGPGVGMHGNSPPKQHLLRRLVAEAPDGCAVAEKLRSRITSLRIDGRDGERNSREAPVDLRALPAFPELRALLVENAEPLLNGAALGNCRKLEDVVLQTRDGHAEIGWLVNLPLQRLSGPFSTLEGASALQALRAYSGWSWVQDVRADLAGLMGCAALEQVARVRVTSGDLRGLPRLRTLENVMAGPVVTGWVSDTLETLTLYDVREVGDLRGLTALKTLSVVTEYDRSQARMGHRPLTRLGPLPASLERLTLSSPGVGSTEGLDALSRLTTVKLGVWPVQSDARWLAGLPALRVLDLGFDCAGDLDSLRDVPLEEVSLAHPNANQIATFTAHPTLQRVRCTPRYEGMLPGRLRPRG